LTDNIYSRFALLAEEGKPLIQRLDPQVRAEVLAALAGLVILALGWMVLTHLGGRHVRRIARERPKARKRDAGDWDKPSDRNEGAKE
jgi:hypothetical protein